MIRIQDRLLYEKICNLHLPQDQHIKLLEIFQYSSFAEVSFTLDNLECFDIDAWYAWQKIVLDILLPKANEAEQCRIYKETATTILTIWNLNFKSMQDDQEEIVYD